MFVPKVKESGDFSKIMRFFAQDLHLLCHENHYVVRLYGLTPRNVSCLRLMNFY